MTIVLTGDKALDKFFRNLPDKLQRGGVRKAVRAGGTALGKEIRKNIDRMVGKDSASRNRSTVRLNKQGKKTSLKRSIGQRAWSKPSRGLIGTVVGPRWPDGAHGHLVEFGHEIVTKDGKSTGKRARPIPFQRSAQRSATGMVLRAQKTKLSAEIRKLRAK